MFGQSPYRRYTKLYDESPKLRALASIDNDLIYPVETSYEDSDTEKSTSLEELFDLPNLHLIPEFENTYYLTIAHTKNKNNDGFRFFQRSANFYGVSPIVVETNKQANDFQVIQTVYDQLKKIKENMKEGQNLVVTVCLEAERTFFGGDPYSTANDFLGYFKEHQILFASQIKNPHSKGNEREDFYPNTRLPYKFLSPNLFISHYDRLQKLFDSFLNRSTLFQSKFFSRFCCRFLFFKP